jgi:predicted KAP-like P-loop ATPase
MTAEDTWMFNPDRAIKNSSEDKLNRKGFADFIGEAILKSRTKESLVIGILGKWGSGKSSIMNMAIEHMEYFSASNDSINKPIIIFFNPWNFSEQNQLIYQFFNQLSIALQMPKNSVKLKKAGNSLKTFGKVLSIGTIIPNYGSTASIGSAALNSAGEAADSLGNLFDLDLGKIKKEISDNLEKQERKIIIVIDDIDRLNDREIRQIFQLVKSLADFPKTVYLLTFDRNVVVKAIEKDSLGNGEEYLEKIIQIPIEIPIISKHELEKYLDEYLKKLFIKYPEDQFESIYWGNIYESGFKYFFKNMRDVTRYINVLNFYFEQVKNEVNVFDFCAITALQLFIPNVYQGIRENKKVFAGIMNSTNQNDLVAYKEICDSIIKSSSEDTQIFLKRFLIQLFPKLNSFYENMFYRGDNYSLWKKRRRISSEDFFDRYFKFSLLDEEISQNDIAFVLACGNDYDKLSRKLLELNYSNKILSFLTLFPDHIDKIQGNVELFVTVLLDLVIRSEAHEALIKEYHKEEYFKWKNEIFD